MLILPQLGMRQIVYRLTAMAYTGKYLGRAADQSAATPDNPWIDGCRLKTVSAYS